MDWLKARWRLLGAVALAALGAGIAADSVTYRAALIGISGPGWSINSLEVGLAVSCLALAALLFTKRL